MLGNAPWLALLLAPCLPCQGGGAVELRESLLTRYLEAESLDRGALREIRQTGAAAVPALLHALEVPEHAPRAHRALRLLGPDVADLVVPAVVASISKDYLVNDDDALATLATLAHGVTDPVPLDGSFPKSNYFADPKPIAVDRDGWMAWLEKLKCWYRFRHRLVRTKNADVDGLVELLATEDPLAREYAALRLGLLGPRAGRALDALEVVRTTERHPRVTRCANGSLTADFHDEVRAAAAVAIARIDPFHGGAVAGLEHILRTSDDPLERSRAALTLGQRSEGLTALLDATQHIDDPQLVADAVTALGMCGWATDRVVARLRELEEHALPQVRKRASAAIRQLKR